jgi:hypothetical protein
MTYVICQTMRWCLFSLLVIRSSFYNRFLRRLSRTHCYHIHKTIWLWSLVWLYIKSSFFSTLKILFCRLLAKSIAVSKSDDILIFFSLLMTWSQNPLTDKCFETHSIHFLKAVWHLQILKKCNPVVGS